MVDKLFNVPINKFYFVYLLLGNMFDWGAQAITAILEHDAVFGLHEALEKIQKRPWLYDGLDKWLDKLEVQTLPKSKLSQQLLICHVKI